jgi:transcriptional regulator with XRE-family HTH domain
MKRFSEWMTRQFLEWQAKQGKRKTLEEFAAYIGVNRPLVNMWMIGTKKPGPANIQLLGELFGMEVYDVLELPRPDPDLTYLQAHWLNLSPHERRKMRESAENYIAKRKTDRHE